MSEHNRPGLDKRRVRRDFDRAAATYDRSAVLQHEVGRRLVERLDYVRLQPKVAVDLGAGTGATTALLAKRYRKARVMALDLSPSSLRIARRRAPWFRKLHCLVGDAERLPLSDASCDLLFSNLALQWCDPELAFREFRRVLRPGGLLLFTTFGPDTLRELRESWSAADGGCRRVSEFIDMHDLGDALLRARFADPVMDCEHFTLTYATVRDLMRDLKAIGAQNAAQDGPPGLTGKARMQAMIQAYERHRTDGVLPATYEVVYGHAWMPERANVEAPVRSVSVPLEAVHGLKRQE